MFVLYTCVSQFSHSVVSNSLRPHGLQYTRLPCPSPNIRACSNSCPLSWWCYSTILSSVAPFSSCLQSFPASGSFHMSQFLASGNQSIRVSASASVLLMMHYLSLLTLETKQNKTKQKRFPRISADPFLSININISIFTWFFKKGKNSLKYDITWFKHTTSLHFPSYLFSCDRSYSTQFS